MEASGKGKNSLSPKSSGAITQVKPPKRAGNSTNVVIQKPPVRYGIFYDGGKHEVVIIHMGELDT